ncbi:CGNR zinc finger domain-containing protein [Embleya sp. MST-111070]|uniref:CGNR zinc finger domain-containing protein n=1 Tax=Embleya sp. MST-111070 TaxID=3398231 RepID=UPI003F7373EA
MPRSAADTRRFRHGAGRLALDFIRTLNRRGTPQENEELPDAEALFAWVRQFCPGGGVVAVAPFAAVSVADARQLREAIHELIVVACRGEGLAAWRSLARERVNRAAAAPTPIPAVDAWGRVRWSAPDPVAATLSLVARDAIDLVDSAAITRVRACAGPLCGVLFLDESRPGTRRWCSMNTCGNRAKKQTNRAAKQKLHTGS